MRPLKRVTKSTGNHNFMPVSCAGKRKNSGDKKKKTPAVGLMRYLTTEYHFGNYGNDC